VDGSELLRCSGLEVPDRRLLAYTVLEIADALYGQRASLWPGEPSAMPTENYVRYLRAIPRALADAASLLEAPAQVPNPEVGLLPTLALSGGAANGAFLAGFVYRLLSVREQALADAGTADRRAIQAQERFGGVVSTSVGSLIGPLVDLYFDDVRSADAGPADGALTKCLGEAPEKGETPPSDRAAQGCALSLLRKYFTRSHDWQLLCIENASVRQLLGYERPSGPVANALAFDPLRDLLLERFYRDFGPRLLGNDLVVEQMSVDVEQRVTLALDERVCRVLRSEEDRRRCLRDNTLASMVEPFLARHVEGVSGAVRRTLSPIRGQWLDGGLRSGAPALRALQLTGWPLQLRSKTAVLAVNSHRAQGTPTSLRDTFPKLGFDTVGTFADQMRSWELGFTGAVAELQREELAVWTAPSGAAPRPLTLKSLYLAEAHQVRMAPQLFSSKTGYPASRPSGGVVDSVVMPENVEFGEPIHTRTLGEYSFDPQVMTQMFVEGERVATLDLKRRLDDLGWLHVADWYARNRARVDGEVIARWNRVKVDLEPSDAKKYQATTEARRKDCLATCQPGGATFPTPTSLCAETVLNNIITAGRPSLPWR
jgi:hypothetical protein